MDASKERKKLHRWEQKNRWMGHYELKYGVLPIEYGAPVAAPVSSTVGAGDAAAAATAAAVPTVLKAKCRFCECFGREAPPSSSASSPDYLTTKAVAAAAAAAAGLEFPGSPMAASAGDATAAAAALDETSSNADDSTGAAHGHGHGGGPLKRRKKRQTLKVFGPNFRTDNLESHLTREHPVKWKEYERLRDADKKAFFPDGPAGGELAASAKELLLAQQVAAAANAAAAMNVATRNAMAAAAAAASTSASGTTPSSHSHAHGSNKLAALAANGGGAATAQIKHMVPTDILAMVEQLLASAALRQHQATALTQPDAGALSWQSFVREDETLADALGGVDDSEAHTATATTAAAAAASGATATGDCKILGTEFGTVALKHEPLFLYVVDVLCLRPSLDTTLAMVQAAQRLVPDAAALLGGLTLTDVAGAVHQLVALNLSCIAQLLSFAWGYSMFLRFVTHNNTGFVDVRVQVAVNDELHDLHLVSLPLDAGKHTVDALGAAIVKALTTVDARAIEKIVGLTIDGDHFHMHKYKDVGVWLKRQVEEATEQAAFYVLYSGAYHVSFIVDELLDHCQADQHFLSTLADLEALCRGNTSLRGLMGPELTRFASARWVSVFNACEWLTVHRETILKWASENEQHLAKLPSTQWWITLFVLRDVLKDVYAAFKKCREHSGSLADVQKHLRDLVFQLRLKFNIKPTMASDAGEVAGVASSATAAELVVELSAAAAGGGSDGSSASATTAAEVAAQLDPCEFSYQDFVSFVIPLDLFMYEAFQLKSIEGITDEDRVALYQRFHLVLMLLVNKVLAVINSSPESPVPDATSSSMSSNSPHQYAMQIPPSIPYDFITMNNVAAMDVLNQQRFRIRSKWTGKVLAMITEDRNRMMAEFAQPSALYEAATNGAKLQQSGAFSFREAWKPFAVEFPSLASFAVVFGGLLSVPRASDDELAHYFFNTNQYAAPTLTLEAHLHAAQFHKLHLLRRHGDATIV